jgi:hypothetical protein
MSILRSFLQTPTAIWFLGILMALAGGVARLALNVVTRVLAEADPQRWQRYGEPSGMFSAPRGSFLGAHSRFLRDPIDELLLHTPAWIRKSERGTRALRIARAAFGVMFLSMALLLYAVFWPT